MGESGPTWRTCPLPTLGTAGTSAPLSFCSGSPPAVLSGQRAGPKQTLKGSQGLIPTCSSTVAGPLARSRRVPLPVPSWELLLCLPPAARWLIISETQQGDDPMRPRRRWWGGSQHAGLAAQNLSPARGTGAAKWAATLQQEVGPGIRHHHLGTAGRVCLGGSQGWGSVRCADASVPTQSVGSPGPG